MPRSRSLLLAVGTLAALHVGGCAPGVDDLSEQVRGSGTFEFELDPWCHYRAMLQLTSSEYGRLDSVHHASPKRDSIVAQAWEAAEGANLAIVAGESSRSRTIRRGAEGSLHPILNWAGPYFNLGPIGNGEGSAAIRYDLPESDSTFDFALQVSVDPVSVCVPW